MDKGDFNLRIIGLFGLTILMSFIGILINSFISSSDFFSTGSEATLLKYQLLVAQCFTYLVPAILFLKLFYKKDWKNTFFSNNYNIWKSIFLSFSFIIVSLGIIHLLQFINAKVGEIVNLENETVSNHLDLLLNVETNFQFIVNILLLALLPAIAEEFFFRASLQKLLTDYFKKPLLGVLLSSIFFSAIHLQFDGFLSRLALGFILGYVFYTFKNLWIPIFCHFAINAIQVSNHFFSDQTSIHSETGISLKAWYYYLISMILTFFVFNLIQKFKNAKI